MLKKGLVGKIAAVFGMVAVAAGIAFASSHGGAGVTPDEALQKLMDGNKRYVGNQMTGAKLSDSAARASLAKSQKPYAIVLTCSDSRVPPEIIFDNSLGEIFVIRVAGNIPDPVVLGSIEYAVEHLGSPLVMVLGHERCGAVTATVGAKGKSTGSANIDAIVKTIAPNIKSAVKNCEACKGDAKCADINKDAFIECVTDANARTVAANLTKKSKIIKHMAAEKKIKIVVAKYDLDDGLVTVFK
ncbi:MAG: carbonic anhydrase [Geobacteraceae bacterium GWC2_55_20]|nr:MAG: carbonic anhydrase [Geobacteraceae bacterium GWC2_55_20]HBA73327.1 carbonic anhydrase [Geobacter sp.]HCE67514.1 carbonic anhydrase [Geobacter sp.]